MISLSKDVLKELIERSGFPRVSLFLPTHRVTAHTEQDRIRLKNLLREAEDHLKTQGARTPDVRELLEPAQRLYEDSGFWSNQGDGLAVFLAPGFAAHYRLPLAFSDLVVVSDRFHVKPLLPLFTGDGRFHVLAISQDSVRLLEGTRDSVSEVDLADVPRSLDEALKYDDPERQLQFHSPTPERSGGHAPMFHGHGQAHGEDPKDRLSRYFHKVDRGLRQRLGNERIPLVLAGVEYYFPIYRQANSYSHLVEEGISGSPEGMTDKEIHERAWAILEPRFRRDQEDAMALYRRLDGTRRASSDLKAILPATLGGRVETLFVAVGRQRWGTFDPATNAVESRDQPEPGDQDLLDLAAVQGFSNGATVYAVEPASVPGGASIAAVFRY
ncbi:MAG: hypothetical protein AB7I30_18340 [Isosphaeraceae bacterium]